MSYSAFTKSRLTSRNPYPRYTHDYDLWEDDLIGGHMDCWKFVIKSGFIYTPQDVKVWTGYAGGNCGKNPEGRNNPMMCGVKDIGPLPPGVYNMVELVDPSHLGPYAIRLEPDPANIMMGRSGFYVHGDTTPSGNASEGCIIAARFIRERMWTTECHQIQVIAE